MSLPKTVIAQDHKLEGVADSASLALMKHRWHWTLDESNPKRVSQREYARSVDRSQPLICKYANGYALTLITPGLSPDEARARAGMSREREVVTEAVAKSHGVNFRTAARDHSSEVTVTKFLAKQESEHDGTPYDRAVRNVIERKEEIRSERKSDPVVEFSDYVDLAAQMEKVYRYTRDALKLVRRLDSLNEERVAVILNDVNSVRSLLSLIELALAGSSNIDWDAELTNLEKEGQ